MIYLDHAATTPLDMGAYEAMKPYLTDVFGNAASQHSYGRAAANALQTARDKIAAIMGVNSDNLYFTASGSEADNTAMKGIVRRRLRSGRAHAVLSAFEHHALIESAEDLKEEGLDYTLVNPGENGIVSPESVVNALRDDTVFVAVMAANNEVGTVQPIRQIYEECRARGIFFFCDCVQIAGVLPFADFPADGVSFSAHKFYGPKGFGGLYMRGNYPFCRLISGGGQERGLRGGTSFVAGAVGCAYALEKAVADMAENNKKIADLRDSFLNGVFGRIPGVHLNGDRGKRLPSNANISFDGCDGEQILFALDLKGIAVSTGSACSSGAVTPSHTLLSMGLGERRAKSAVRFTFGKDNTESDVKETLSALRSAVERIRGN